MTRLDLIVLLIIAEFVKIKNFVAITIIVLLIFILCNMYNKKIRKYIVLLYTVYFLGIFVVFLPINKYGADIFTVYFLKRKLVPSSFIHFKNDLASKKKLVEKIRLSYSLARDIKYQIREFDLIEKELQKVKGLDKSFKPWIDTSNKL